MTSQGWDEDDLLEQLRRAVRQAGTPTPTMIAAGQAAYSWRTVDAELVDRRMRELLPVRTEEGNVARGGRQELPDQAVLGLVDFDGQLRPLEYQRSRRRVTAPHQHRLVFE